ncbi:prolyl oligopeptidase family serine peptidase [Sphingomicrobium arenosum]|uniref:prolyl oligopeptidase family serine peptidase n=1 Tax=Sphingomicrobium arenosum TaxID=2233861 RepID=UPI0022408A10|nr:prolyl oligopeptidase family serine peptidase [Sphingomicrobium arenosum]
MRLLFASCALAALTSPLAVTAAAAQDSYRLPPAEVADIVMRAPPPTVSVSPDGDQLLLLHRESYPPVSELAKPMERLAGIKLDPAINDNYNPRAYVGMTLRDIATGEERVVALPDNADIADVNWSPDGNHVVFTHTRADGMALMLLDTRSGTARTLLESGINPIFQEPSFLPDGRVLALISPPARGPMPQPSLSPEGPAIQDAAGGEEAQTRTWQNLLENPDDEARFEWLATSMPVAFPLDGGAPVALGSPRIYQSVAPSPDGQYLLMEWNERPFSYQVPYWSFPLVSAVTTITGEPVAEIARQPLADNLPVQGVVTGRRNIGWHPTKASSLLWVEAQDGGDPRVEADVRDTLFGLAAPFTAAPRRIADFEDRFSGTYGIEGSDDLIAYDYDRDTRELRTAIVDVDGAEGSRVIQLRNSSDAYADIGSPVTVTLPSGKTVARSDGEAILLSGSGATPEGLRPFISRLDLDTLEVEELWRNSGEYLEQVVDVLDDGGTRFVTRYESPTNPGNYRLHAGDEVSWLTAFEDPHPELTGISREVVTYKRADGTDLTATLYLPPDYEEGERLPLVVWAYPWEYSDASIAGQNRDSPYRFARVGGYSQLFFLTQGYAVLDNAAMPVIGADPETVNDSFIEQIVSSAQAAVDFADERGVADPDRVGVGGHSYGAFMTAHLLAQSDIFKAGVARSGAYNRTLTPFGFQAERRVFWDAPETYYMLSPFMAANKIDEPLLLIHGEKDSNPGTYPQQSERMFAAIRGTGGTARLVMLPHEDHGYRGRENVLHTLAEMIDWFDAHVKNAPAQAAGSQ